MNLQKQILFRYRQSFPTDTLREVSLRTGIQITRVFRLFNGKTMKVGELESFQNVINQKISEKKGLARIHYILDEAGTLLSSDELSKIADLIERKVLYKNYSKTFGQLENQEAIIA